jgi:hypothetical protein
MWKLIRGIFYIAISTFAFVYTFETGLIYQNIIFFVCIILAGSITKDGWVEYKISKKQ